jgi:AraC-like DNA-binding protein
MIFEKDDKNRIRGPARRKFSTTLKDRGGVFAVKFTPAGFHPFASQPVSNFCDQTVRLRDVFGSEADVLNHAVLSESTDLAKISLLEQFLRGQRPKPDENVSQVTEMVYAVAQERGILQVQDLVERYGLNKRTLQRLFAAYVCVSPKWVIQRYRLHEAAEQLAVRSSSSHGNKHAFKGLVCLICRCLRSNLHVESALTFHCRPFLNRFAKPMTADGREGKRQSE